MKILIRQFLGQHHSWSVCGWGWANAFISMGHEVHLFATDGTKHLPANLRPNLIGYTELNQQQVFGRLPDNSYDMSISYTCPKNVLPLLGNTSKNRFNVWVYEWKNAMPTGFAKNYQHCEYMCPPSNFGKQIYLDAGIPENRIKVIPHGIDAEKYRQTSTIELTTKKKFKLLANIAQLHLRKNIPGLLEAYGKAFSNKDDVCLILKVKDKPVISQFEVSLKDCLNTFYQQFPRHAEVKIFSDFIEDVSSLYRSIDCVYSLSNCEGFLFPLIEGISAGKLGLCPNWGGQLDFLNNSNALLISGKEERADPKSMYWESSPRAIWFKPSIDDAVSKLRYAYENYEALNAKVEKQREDVYAKYDWQVIANQFISLTK